MQGQKIGEMGSTGNSKGPHLHLGTTWKVRDEKDTQAGPHGVTLFKEQLDPQLVIERGAVHAARISGARSRCRSGRRRATRCRGRHR